MCGATDIDDEQFVFGTDSGVVGELHFLTIVFPDLKNTPRRSRLGVGHMLGRGASAGSDSHLGVSGTEYVSLVLGHHVHPHRTHELA